MTDKSFAEKADGYRRRALYEWHRWRTSAEARKREHYFHLWLRRLSDARPDVLIGANFAAFGGVRHHLQAILKYSALKVEMVPGESLMQKLSPHHFVNDFNDQFYRFCPGKVRAVHSHVYPWFIEWCRQQQRRGIRWVHTYHLNYYPEHGTGKLEPWQEEFNESFLKVAPMADVLLSVSRWQSEELMRKHGITTEYLPNGVDVPVCDASKADRFIRKVGIRNFVLYVGRNDPVKNPVEFVRLAERLPEHKFVMAGGGLSRGSLLSDWGIDAPANLVVVGSLSHGEVQDAIAACSALVVTSKREGLPTLVMEGMAHSKTVVVPDEPGCMEVINQGEFGFVYRPGNIDDLADKTLRAIGNTEIGENARKRVLKEYDWRIIAPRLDSIYKGVN